MRTKRHRRRNLIRFQPLLDQDSQGAVVLDRRLLLSADTARAAHVGHHASDRAVRSRVAARPKTGGAASSRVTPAQEINNQYAQFLAAFQTVAGSYVQSLNQSSSGTTTVSATLTAPYLAGTASMQVDDAAVFGPAGIFATPITATALVGSVPVGQFVLTGSSANSLAVDPTLSSAVSLASGTVLTAQVATSASSSAGTILPSYLTASAQQLAVKLVTYFNSLPFKLPRMFALPHQSQRSGALQQYVYQVVAGGSPNSLEHSLLAISLPQTTGSDLQIYNAAVNAAVTTSRLQMLNGVEQIFGHKLQVVPSSTLNSSTLTGGTGSTSTGGTGSTSTATA